MPSFQSSAKGALLPMTPEFTASAADEKDRFENYIVATRSFFAAAVGVIMIILGGVPSSAQNAYITNSHDNTVSVIATATNTVVGLPIPVGDFPFGVAVSPDGSKVYVTNTANLTHNYTVSVIATATNTVTATIPVGGFPTGVAVSPDGSIVYVATGGTNVSVIATATNTVTATIQVGYIPEGVVVAITPDGSKIYVANSSGNTVSVIATATNTVVGTIPLFFPFGVAVTPDGSRVYVTSPVENSVSVIDTATNMVIGAPIPVGNSPFGVAVTPDGSKVYVANDGDNTVSVIATATNTVVGFPIPVGSNPYGVAITPDGSKVYVANDGDNTVSVIATATNMVVAALPVGQGPIGFGVFIQPRFGGTPETRNCIGASVAALLQTFGSFNAAAIALGFPTALALQTAVNGFCGAPAAFARGR
jgi:YVTN family beta-propeller protein